MVFSLFQQPGKRLIDGSVINTLIGLTTGTTSFTKIKIGTVTINATLLGAGNVTTPVNMGTTANTNAVAFYGTTAATTGTTRNIYSRLFFTGAGDGEAIRALGTVNNATVATTAGAAVNGLHASLNVTGASGAITGSGNGVKATIGLGASTSAGGTLASVQFDTDFDTAATVPATAAYMRFTNTNTKKMLNFANLDGVDTTTLYVVAGTGAGSAGNATHCAAQQVIKILVNGSAAYIPIFTQNT